MAVGIAVETRLEVKECPVCGIFYGIPEKLSKDRLERGGSWYCPNGHVLVYTETEVNKLKRKLEEMEGSLNQAISEKQDATVRLNECLDKMNKTRKRIYAGVCPDCHRHFVNVERHMKSKHGTKAESDSVKKEMKGS